MRMIPAADRRFRLVSTVMALFLLAVATAPGSAGLDAALSPEITARENFAAASMFTSIPEETLTTGSIVAQSVSTIAQSFPHTAMYGNSTSSGWPFVGSTEKLGTCQNNDNVTCAFNTDCGSIATVCNNPARQPGPSVPLNDAVIRSFAKFPLVILPPTPLSDGRPDIIPALRSYNPLINIFAYVVGHVTWCPGHPGNISYPVGYFYRDYYMAVSDGDPSCLSPSNRFLWGEDDDLWEGANVNLAYREQQPDTTYRYLVAEALAETIYAHSKKSTGFDGIFIDIFCRGVRWQEALYGPINLPRAGYPDGTAFDLGWAAGHQRMGERLRELAIADGQSDYPIAANCAQAPAELHEEMNGWMRENYPYQNGGTFYSNILAWPWGYLHQDRNFRAPQLNTIFTNSDPATQPYTEYNQQKMRFGLGSASLGNGYHTFEDGTASPNIVDYYNWWYDEYAVMTSAAHASSDYGRAVNNHQYNGWLGQPLGEMYQMVYPDFSAVPDRLTTNQSFETAGATPSQLVGWNSGFSGTAQGTISRDTTTAGEGTASAKIHIDQLGTVTGNVTLSPATTFSISANQQYSITFWAKASVPRSIEIAMHTNPWPVPGLPITTEWRRYQIQIRATQSSSSGYMIFYLGQATGDIWIDDVHVQAGSSSVFRRNFERGIVLVNPTDATQVVALEKPYKKILGSANPSLNDGSVVSSVTLTPDVFNGVGDAVFLLNYDGTAPDPVSDLSAS